MWIMTHFLPHSPFSLHQKHPLHLVNAFRTVFEQPFQQ
ncbi:unnamed protein product [Schistosoma margrebowiei]|uniref:Uncharacterized protein n=1 Tax=Schistosoma margrebowiei TaxID=48269 RepID=A0A183LN63_9TREM|nr:unnamed protein product [Schistosoma margrebowiei]